MSDFRAKYGWAIGPVWTGSAQTTNIDRSPLLAQANSRPNVTVGALLYTANTATTTLENLNLDTVTRSGVEYEGKIVTLFFQDDSTKLVNDQNVFFLSGSDALLGSNNIVQLMYHNSSWFEVNRSRNYNDYVRVGSHLAGTVNYSAMSSITVTGRRFIECFAATGTPFTILTLRGGEAGQRVTLFAVNSEFAITANSQGLFGGGTAGFIVTSTGSRLNVASNATVSFVFNGTQWIEDR